MVLKNGLTLLVEEQPINGLFAIVTYVKSGYGQESPEVYGVSQLLGQLYAHHSQISRKIGGQGSELRVETKYSSMRMRSCGPANNWSRILKLHADILRAPELDPGKIQLESSVLIEKSRRMMRSSEAGNESH